MFNTIVVGTDGSSTADIAVARGAELARLTGASLHIVSAYTPTPARVVGERASGEYSIGPDYKVDAVLGDAIAKLRAEGLEIQTPRARRETPPTRSSTWRCARAPT